MHSQGVSKIKPNPYFLDTQKAQLSSTVHVSLSASVASPTLAHATLNPSLQFRSNFEEHTDINLQEVPMVGYTLRFSGANERHRITFTKVICFHAHAQLTSARANEMIIQD